MRGYRRRGGTAYTAPAPVPAGLNLLPLPCDAHETSVRRMDKMLQIRNVPEKTHRLLKARAALEGVSMSHLVLREIERVVRRPSRREVLEAIRREPAVTLDESPADILCRERDARGS